MAETAGAVSGNARQRVRGDVSSSVSVSVITMNTAPWIPCEHELDADGYCLTVPDWLYDLLYCAPLGREMIVDKDWGVPIRSFESH